MRAPPEKSFEACAGAPPQAELSAKLWAARVLEPLQLPDARLKGRAMELLGAMAEHPSDSIPQACSGRWAATKGAYRFLSNERVSARALRQGALESAARACTGRRVVLAVQDSTSFSMPKAHRTEGLGLVGSFDVRGFYLHSLLFLDEAGEALGLGGQRTWARMQWREITKGERKRLPLEEKESFKWFDLMRRAREALAALAPQDRPYLIHVFDREGDIHEAFAELDAYRAGEGFVIRCNQNRAALGADGARGLAHGLVAQSPLLGRYSIDVPRKHGQKPRRATLEVRSVALSLASHCPHHRGRRREAPLLSLVEAREVDCPEGCEPLHWMLWTSEPASTLQECLRVIDIYTKRWRIEEYHLILKSGCGMEELRLSTLAALEKALILYALVAVRILQLRDASRQRPEEPCTQLLGELEWRALQAHVTGEPPKPSDPPPTMRQAVLWIGALGGHLGRKGDGMPGVRVLWKGLRDLQLLTRHARILARHPPHPS